MDKASTNDFWAKQEYIYRHAYVSMTLLVINILVFIASATFAGNLYEDGAMITERILVNGEFYRILTSMFLHADVNHLFNNMIIMILVGGIIENYTGHIYYLLIYFLSGFFGNFLSMAYELKNSLNWISIGASGAIMGVVGVLVAWLIANRKRLVQNRNMLLRLLLMGVFVVQACFFQEGANTAAHLGGFLTGFVLGIINIVIFGNNKYMEGIA